MNNYFNGGKLGRYNGFKFKHEIYKILKLNRTFIINIIYKLKNIKLEEKDKIKVLLVSKITKIKLDKLENKFKKFL